MIAIILATRGIPGLCGALFSTIILRELGWRRPIRDWHLNFPENHHSL